MTNKEAADELQYAINLIKQDGKDWLDERDIPILEAAISALQAQDSPKPTAESAQNVQNEDLISRKAAIDALVKAIRNDPYYDSNERINGLGVCDVRVIINDLQSAQPETAKRIVGKSRGGMTLWYQCDMCNEPVDAQDNFCRGCGRRLTDG